MDNIFCTIFDSNYLDKGLVLYDSMINTMEDFRLYIFAFDDLCYQILSKENLKNTIVISLEEFETKELLEVKKTRTKAEYCWTCSPWVIKYVLDKYKEDICTYIDADMKFFYSPDDVFHNMRENSCSIIIVPHRFATVKEEKEAHEKVGSYCVEFNTFVNDRNGIKALNWWADRCLEWCYYAIAGTTEWYGDQKYLNVFPEKFDGVYISNELGVGLAPWNVHLVNYVAVKDNKVLIESKFNKKQYPIVIYHFENVVFLNSKIINASSRKISKTLKKIIYDSYIFEIIEKRKYLLDKYSFVFSNQKRVLTNNKIMRLYHKYITPIKRIEKLSDIYIVK